MEEVVVFECFSNYKVIRKLEQNQDDFYIGQ